MKPTKRDIMRSANYNAPREGRKEALKRSHRDSKGTYIGNGKVAFTLKQQNRLFSDYSEKPSEDIEINLEQVDFGML